MDDKERSQSILHHKLLEPLTIILGNAGILLEGLAGELNEEQKIRLLKIKETSEKLTNNIKEFLLKNNL